MEEQLARIMVPFLGLFIGSFANVLIWRIPRAQEWVRTPSHCTSCGHRLAWFELIPVLSWLALGGKCRACRRPISIRYPVIELINALLWWVCVAVFGLTAFLPVSLALATLLLVLAVIDWETKVIPDGIQIALLVCGIVWNGYALYAGQNVWFSNLIGFFAVSVPLFLIAVLTKGGMGGGDIKLTAVCGLILGWKPILLALALAAILGTALMLPVHIVKKKDRKETIPFGPFLAAGVFLAMCAGQQILSWYWSFF